MNFEKIKIMLELTDSSKDLLLEMMVEDVTEYLEDLGIKKPKESLIRRLVVLRFNALGSEGLSSESYNGISQNFLDDLPKDIKREINSLKVVKF